MVELHQDTLSSGTWLRLEEDGRSVVGAYVDSRPVIGLPFTIAWLGDPAPTQVVDFFRNIYPTLAVNQSGQMVLIGQAFALGKLSKFSGDDWLKAATLPKAEFVRLTCRAERQVTGPSVIAEEIIMWARLAMSKQEDESIGVKLPLTYLSVLEDKLAMFIASSHVERPQLATVKEALTKLAAHLRPGSRPLAATG
ncbi:hypothetical protein [Bradyrhizobium sp. S3.2.12]|uniref:hypothetical protein n=1 Tax=Bradyrhizobium sp. S3.2.12 TaxID=3156387 RepID=UPI00339258FC